MHALPSRASSVDALTLVHKGEIGGPGIDSEREILGRARTKIYPFCAYMMGGHAQRWGKMVYMLLGVEGGS